MRRSNWFQSVHTAELLLPTSIEFFDKLAIDLLLAYKICMKSTFPITVYDNPAKVIGGILMSALMVGLVVFGLVFVPRHYASWNLIPLVAVFTIPLFGTLVVLG